MKKIKILLYLTIISVIGGCIEQVEFDNVSFDTNLVVKAIITNEVKQHTVELSRTIPIDSTELSPEKSAFVSLVDDLGTTYNFTETEDGIYTSINSFGADPARSYTLSIQTNNGQRYNSTTEKLPENSNIDDIRASVENDDIEGPFIAFKVNATGNSSDGSYYRYEYDETYKIKSFVWSPFRIRILSNISPYDFDYIPKDPDIYGEGFCYTSDTSNSILITETKTLSQDQVSGFTVRKVPLQSYIVGQRYSILLKQYVLNQNTYDYYTLLDKFSDPSDIFTQTQVGNIPSNITSENNPTTDLVIGFFEVSSITSKRFFFNRTDITDAYYDNYTDSSLCDEFPNPAFNDGFGNSPFLELLNTHIFYNEPPGGLGGSPSGGGPYQLILKQCGDCSHLGSVIEPDFWIE
ncbi:conserved hypothetical protein [Tenacibaculum sp. 190524A05c]|uniref:DUF4249 domain-containing protein n=1 Tax=Tenacibaculum platacis TaxID=3137852 RepID=UPI0031FAAA76